MGGVTAREAVSFSQWLSRGRSGIRRFYGNIFGWIHDVVVPE
jgi:hypothetical protein